MRIYLSGQITNAQSYEKQFRKSEKKLRRQGHDVINPVKISKHLPQSFTYEEYMKIDLFLLKHCDAIYMLSGWSESNGAKRERREAIKNGLKVIYEEATHNEGNII